MEFIFKLCDEFDQPDPARFITVDIFNDFMNSHLEHLFNFLKSKGLERNEFHSDWKCIFERAERQLPLRIASCMQISSKFNQHSKIITTNRIKNWLARINLDYKTDAICKSEIRVLKAIDHQIIKLSPYDSIEALIEALAHNDPDFKASVVFSYSVKLLKYFYLERRSIFKRLWDVIFDPMNGNLIVMHEYESKFKLIKANVLLVSAAIVACAQYLSDRNRHAKVVQQMSRIADLSQDDITIFANVMMQSLLA